MRHAVLSSLAFTTLTVMAADARAHVDLIYPPPMYPNSSEQKSGPCGSGAATGDVTTLEAGSTITIRWTETVEHPGHYRISFDAAGVDDFEPPASASDMYTNAAVMVDGIPDAPGKNGGMEYTQTITLPDAPCDDCTLQLVQVMTDKLGDGFTDSGDTYHRCAKIVLLPKSSSTGTGGTGGTGGATASNGGGGVGGEGGGGTAGAGGSGEGGEGGAAPDPGDGCSCSTAPAGQAPVSLAALAGLALLGVSRRRARRH